VFSLFVSTAVSQHSEGDSTAPNGLIGQPDPAISLSRESELVVQALQMLFDGGLCNEQLKNHPTNQCRLRQWVLTVFLNDDHLVPIRH
jgi:hypothetical protein